LDENEVDVAAVVGNTTKESVALAVSVGDVESVTCTVMVELPCVLGKPVMAPAGESDIPAGKEPPLIAHE
jgi:hypothetical protein